MRKLILQRIAELESESLTNGMLCLMNKAIIAELRNLLTVKKLETMQEFKFKIGDRVEVMPEHDKVTNTSYGAKFTGLTGFITEDSEDPFVKLDNPQTDKTGFVWDMRAFNEDHLKSI